MDVSENCIERRRHPVPTGWTLIPLDRQKKRADLRDLPLSISWTVWKGTCFETDGLRELEFLENFHCSSCSLPTITVQGLPEHAIHFFTFQGRPYLVFQVPHEVCLHSKASFAKLTSDGFCFPSAWGSREWALCIYQSTRSFPSSYPRALSLSWARNQWVWRGDLHWVRHNSGSLCALISLNQWKVKCLKVGQLWGCPPNINVGCLFFWIFTKELLPEDLCTPAHRTPNPRITKIHNKNKTAARLKVILPKQDFFL